ncbi:MAG: Zn-ribbon domain-containing OB-fold protein [Gammaproteobacteria bacterium]|nr:Zn-ribbon domain-containing OB-fold protein [Gammaproteobacteria bacterium]
MSVLNEFENADSHEFWKAAAEGRLIIQQCNRCKAVQYPPRRNCAACWHDQLDWIEGSGKGTVESFTIVARAPTQDFREKVPYVVAAVRLDEGPLMITNIVGDDRLGVQVSESVTAVFEDDGRGNQLPQFMRLPGNGT